MLMKNSKGSDLYVVASCSGIKSSVQKINLVASMIRKKNISESLLLLSFSNKKISYVIEKLLKSAIANAQHNCSLDVDSLYISDIIVGKAASLKRFSPRAKGRANKIIKHYSKIKLVLKVI